MLGETGTVRRLAPTLALALFDAILVTAAVVGAYALRFDGVVPSPYRQQMPWVAGTAVAVRIGLLVAGGLYRRVWAYASLSELLGLAGFNAIGSMLMFAGNVIIRPFAVPRSIWIIELILSTALVGGMRVALRFLAVQKSEEARLHRNGNGCEKRLLIVGAGDAGAMAAREIRHSTGWSVVGFVDDDAAKWGCRIHNIPVLGGRNRLHEVVTRLRPTEVLVAMPSVSRQVIREVVSTCQNLGLPVRTLPALYEVIDGRVTVNSIRSIQIEDLLGREPVQVDIDRISSYLKGKRVLVTGAGGSIGLEICRQVLRFGPERLVLLGRGEYSLFKAAAELRRQGGNALFEPLLGDIRDRIGLLQLFARIQPDVVFHTAAHKHVPMLEARPREAVTNNVFGTLNVLEACTLAGAERVVFISTDKAADPVGALGASKRIGEFLVQVAAQGQLMDLLGRIRKTRIPPIGDGARPQEVLDTSGGGAWWRSIANGELCPGGPTSGANPAGPVFVAVRFGNVLGSRGSVVEIFQAALAEGRDLEVTHSEMRRYFMTIPEAVSLVIQAGGMGDGGETFVLDMGEPVRVMELAQDMARLAGLQPGVDVQIRVTSPRDGEKLTEQLVGGGEEVRPTAHPRIHRIEGPPVVWDTLADHLARLAEALDRGEAESLLGAWLLEAAYAPVRQQVPYAASQ